MEIIILKTNKLTGIAKKYVYIEGKMHIKKFFPTTGASHLATR